MKLEQKVEFIKSTNIFKSAFYLSGLTFACGVILHIVLQFYIDDSMVQVQKVLIRNPSYADETIFRSMFEALSGLYIFNCLIMKLTKWIVIKYEDLKVKNEKIRNWEVSLTVIFYCTLFLQIKLLTCFVDVFWLFHVPLMQAYSETIGGMSEINHNLNSSGFYTISIFLIALFIVLISYLLPTIIAYKRAHHNRLAILLLNVLLGWSFLGWIAAIVWSGTAVKNNDRLTSRSRGTA